MPVLCQQVHNYMMPPHDRTWRDYAPDQPHPEIPYQCPVTFGPRGHHWQGPSCENGKECAREGDRRTTWAQGESPEWATLGDPPG